MLTFASEYLVKFCIFNPHHSSLETVFPALKVTQICCINIHETLNISYLENWQFKHKLAPPLLHAWKIVLTIRENTKVSETQKYQFSNSLVNWKKFGSIAKANIKKSQYSITFMNWKKLWSPTRAKLANPSFQYFSKLGKSMKCSLRPSLKNLSVETKEEFTNYVPIWVSLLKIKGIYIK